MRLIDESLFEGCRSLTEIELPTRLVKLGRRAFKDCTSLSSVIMPEGLKSIGFDAFSGCSSLRRISIPKGLVELEDLDVFDSCDSLVEISFGGDLPKWEFLVGRGALTIQHSDLSVSTPKVIFLDLKDEV
jgi:hypothetical protein